MPMFSVCPPICCMESIERMVRIWLTTEFDAGRHQRRIDKIANFESSEKK